MTIDWTPLDRELDHWRAAGRSIPIWWRDDDAVSVTPALDRLEALSKRTGVPVHLAIIPAHAEPALARHLDTRDHLIPLVHGWSHENHKPGRKKQAEFGDHRPVDLMADSCQDALRRMQALFRDRLVPLFVPPWNRISDDLLPRLPGLGYVAISTMKPREARLAAPGLERINTHFDPINWKAEKVLQDPGVMIAQVAGDLADRRAGRTDADEPYGLLTHHLVHDDAIWDFTEAFLQRLLTGPVTFWRADSLLTKGD